MSVYIHVSTHEWKAYKNRIYILLGLAIFSLLATIFGFMIIERYSFREAFYMTVITISTLVLKVSSRYPMPVEHLHH